MYILNKPLALIGVVIAFLSTIFCPFLKVPLIGNWNMYQTDYRLFFITNGILAIAVFFYFIRSIKAFKWSCYIFLGWIILAIVAVYFQINNYFGLKIVDGLLAKTLHMKWGWAVILISAFMMILSVRKLSNKL